MSDKGRRVRGHITRLKLPPRLWSVIIIASLALACSSAAAPATSTSSASTGTSLVDGTIQPPPRATGEAAATPAPTATRAPRATSRKTVGTAAAVSAPAEASEPAPQSTGTGHDNQAPPIPDKGGLKYPNLGSRLDGLVTSVEAGQTTAEEAAAETPVHSGGSVAVTIYLSGSVDGVVSFLQENGAAPRNMGEDYVETYVPVTLLGPVSERPGVIRVREIVPPEPGGSG